jgi:hypothetical protein
MSRLPRKGGNLNSELRACEQIGYFDAEQTTKLTKTTKKNCLLCGYMATQPMPSPGPLRQAQLIFPRVASVMTESGIGRSSRWREADSQSLALKIVKPEQP